MAKKKRKKFQKKQLLSLFYNENYQKVISKIKQFEIEGISDNELHQIQITSYKKMAENHFQLGDINRAIRDIESLLKIDNGLKFKLIKLKYLCYMEHFQDAILFAKELIDSKNAKIKKEAIFLYILANLYSGDYSIDEKYLKLLPSARVNYILGFRELLKGDRDQALLYLDKSNPRAKIEKDNIKAIKSIILNQDMNSDNLKPLYRFLISGDDTNLQNTKNSRAIKKEILAQFSKNKKNSDIENLISLKSSIPIETITKEIKDKEEQIKLIYNNIILLVEKDRNYNRALELFIKNRNQLVQFVESGLLFIQLKSLADDEESDKLILNFFINYLKLHYKKLSLFQLDFIFIFILQHSPNREEASVRLVKDYGGEDMIFILKDLMKIKEVEPSHQERFNRIFKKYSFLKAKNFEGLAETIDFIDENSSIMGLEETDEFVKQLSITLILLQNAPKIHKKYQYSILKFLSSMANLFQNLDFDKNRELYTQLYDTINRFIENYQIDKSELSENIQRLFSSIKNQKNMKPKEQKKDKNVLDMLRDIMNDEELDYSEFFDDEYLDKDDLKEIKQKFIDALRVGKDPFLVDRLEELEESFYNDTLFEFALEMTSKAIEFKRYDDYFIYTLLEEMGINPFNSNFRNDLIMPIQNYAKKDIETALIFLNDCIVSTPKKDRETVWYLNWLEAYIYLVDDYNRPKDKKFKACLQHFLRVQQKKRFKTLNAKFNKLINRFKDKGLF